MDIVPYGERLPAFEALDTALEALPVSQQVHRIYQDEKLDDLLHKFAFEQPISDEDPRIVDEDVVGDGLLRYALRITYIATQKATAPVDTDIIKDAFGHVYRSMDSAAELKINGRPNALRRLLDRAGVTQPSVKRHFSPLDDTFWNEHFPKEMREETYVRRRPGEPEAGFAARCVYHSLSTRTFAPFTYLPQATHFA